MKKIVVAINGGMGNQMFCFAVGYGLSKDLNAKFYIESSMMEKNAIPGRNFEIEGYNLVFDGKKNYCFKYNKYWRRLGINKLLRRLSIGLSTKIIEENAINNYSELYDIKGNFYLNGYWQNVKLFDKYKNDLFEIFTPKNQPCKKTVELIEKVSSCNSVAMHIRKGDYVTAGWAIDNNFYVKALDIIKDKKIEGVKFFIFSDDIDRVRSEFDTILGNYDVEFVVNNETKNSTFDDFLVLSNCKHIIMSNSTYSWWAAYLNKNEDAIKIAPKLGAWNEDFYTSDTMLIDASLCDGSKGNIPTKL